MSYIFQLKRSHFCHSTLVGRALRWIQTRFKAIIHTLKPRSTDLPVCFPMVCILFSIPVNFKKHLFSHLEMIVCLQNGWIELTEAAILKKTHSTYCLYFTLVACCSRCTHLRRCLHQIQNVKNILVCSEVPNTVQVNYVQDSLAAVNTGMPLWAYHLYWEVF